MKKNAIITFICAVLFLTAGLSYAQPPVTIKADLDRTRCAVQDQLILTINVEVEGSRSQITEPEPETKLDPSFYVVQAGTAQRQSMVNNQWKLVMNYRYAIFPLKQGKYTIPPYVVRYRNAQYKTDPIYITVDPPRKKAADPKKPPPHIEGNVGGNVSIAAWANKDEIYKGEQLIYSMAAFFKPETYNLLVSGKPKFPKFTGFWAERLVDARKSERRLLNGQQYECFTYVHGLFPTTAGDLEIDPVEFDFEYKVPITNYRYSLKKGSVATKPLTIKVKPLPEEGRPEGFTGAVGRYYIEARVDKKILEANQTINLEIKIGGDGNINAIGEYPAPVIENVSVYKAKQATNNYENDMILGGEITANFLLTPRQDGEMEIPSFSYSFFDPVDEEYKTINTEPIRITVTEPTGPILSEGPAIGTRSRIAALSDDFRYIKTSAGKWDQARPKPVYKSTALITYQFLPLLFLLTAVLYKRRMNRLAVDVAFARMSRAKRNFSANMKTAASHLKAGDRSDYFNYISRAVREFIGDRFNVPAASLDMEIINGIIEDSGLDMEIAGACDRCLEICDMARYAPSQITDEDMEEARTAAEKVVSMIERGR